MKTIKLLFATIITVTLFSCGKMTLPEPVPSEIYFKLYGCYFNDYLTSVHVDNEKNVFLSGYTVTENDSSYAYILKSFSDGMRDWDIRSEVPFSKAFDIFYVEKSEAVFALLETQVSEDSAQISLIEYDFTGKLQHTWNTKVRTSKVQSMSMVYQQNGTIRIFSQIDIEDSNNKEQIDNYIVVHDLVDNTLTEMITYSVENRISGPISILQTSENTTYIIVTVAESKNDNFTDIRLLYAEKMAVVWDKPLGDKGVSESAADVKLYGAGLAIAGNLKQETDKQKIIFYYTDIKGIEQSRFTTAIDDFEEDITATSFCINNYGNLVFTGYKNTGDNKSDIFFLETSPDGENLKSNNFGTEGKRIGENRGKIIKYLPATDSYILGGDLEPITNTDICIFSLDKEADWIKR